MKIKSFFFALSALLFSCAAFSQDSTKMSTTHHMSTMSHSKKHPMHKSMTTTHTSKMKKSGSTNASDSAK